MKRRDSSVPQFKQRIPEDVRQLAIGRTLVVSLGRETVSVVITAAMATIRFSLRTRDPGEAKARQGQAAATAEIFWTALRNSRPASLDHRKATALAGDLYRAWADSGADRTVAVTHTPHGWVPDRSTPDEEREGFASAVSLLDAADGATDDHAERLVGPLIDRLLLARGIASVDAASRPILLVAFVLALRDAFALRSRNAAGDYSPDPKAVRFPDWQPPHEGAKPRPEPSAGIAKASLTALVASWWQEKQAVGLKPSTHESYRNTMACFVAFLKHDDAGRVTADNVIAFKDHRLSKPSSRTGKRVSAKTVKDSDLAGLRAVFEWAVSNRRMASNPAKDVKLRLGTTVKLRSKGFTDAEAGAILTAASAHVGRSENPKTASAKRWVPWLQAYTGARVGEMAQLRKQDLRKEGPHWLLTITPEAGTVKTNQARVVPLHEHMVALGFAEFVMAAKTGHLFLNPADDGGVVGPLQGVKNRLAEFARAIVSDTKVAPTHGWRHHFKTRTREAGISDSVADAIQGHAPKSEGQAYGDVTVKTLADAMGRLPRIELNHEPTAN